MDRLASERDFHDAQARDRAAHFRDRPADLRFADADFLGHETWVRPAFAMLGDLRGKAALDYGCGHGMAAVVLARAGATVSAFDLSPQYVEEAKRRAEANGVAIDATPADAENLPYPDASFDAVWGNAILHHLDLDCAGSELKRVLKPGGVAVFCEPWGGNPLLGFARRRLPYPGKDRTPDEVPLDRRGLAVLRRHFPNLRTEGFQLFGMVRRLTKFPPVTAVASALDWAALGLCPPLKNWCRYLAIRLPRR